MWTQGLWFKAGRGSEITIQRKRCCGENYGMLVYGPHQGLCPHPCSCHPPSGLPHPPPIRRTPTLHPARTTPSKNTPLLHPPQILFPWPDSEPGSGVHGCVRRDPPSHISRKRSRHTRQSMLLNLPAIGCLAILSLAPVWSSLHPAWTQIWRSDFLSLLKIS